MATKATQKDKKEEKTVPKTSTNVVAKAGKRSKKSVELAEQKKAKQTKKAKTINQSANKKVSNKPKPKQLKLSKNQKAARALIDKDKLYNISEAIELLPKLSKVKFDATAEVHIVLNIDPKQSDQLLRTSVSLPAGSGKKLTIAAIVDEKFTQSAKKAGADKVDSEELISQIQKGKINFDVLVTTPDKMSDIAKLAKILGPKGLMPSPKNGTVTTEIVNTIEDIKKGKVELKNDPSGIVHVAFGKLSFKSVDLENNLNSIISAIKANKPTGVKGSLIKNIYISSTMSPSIKIDKDISAKK